MTTLIILNPHAGNGRAGKLWSKIEPLLWKELGELVVAVTQRPEDVAEHLDKARAAGLTRVIAIGGDGTNHALINELVRINREHPGEPQMTFGNLPVGTGRDWARALGIPFTPEAAVSWIKAAHPVPLDIGALYTEGRERHFLNIASVGIGGVIGQRVNRMQKRPWTFYKATVEALLTYRPPHMTVRLDGTTWYDGPAYAVAVANGQTFGHGMKIAPYAIYNDGLFDVVLVEGMPRTRILAAFNTVYSGTHLKRSDVHSARAHTVEIESPEDSLGMELDGEDSVGNQLTFQIIPNALSTLVKPIN